MTKQLVREVVWQAIRNKYSALELAEFVEYFEQAWRSSEATMNRDELLSLTRAPKDAREDVGNQVVVLQLIERYWRSDANLKRPLATIHALASGEGNEVRTSDAVEDFDGVIPTSVDEIGSRLDELERVAEALVGRLREASSVAQTAFLAHMFAAIIRIHPFPDGNGRTARIFVQYALRCWGLPFVIVPKVRNDVTWRTALVAAIGGSIGPLAEQFMLRIGTRA